MRRFSFILVTILISAAVSAATQNALSPDEQRTIVEDYLYVMGLRAEPSASAAEELAQHGETPLKCGMAAVAEFVTNRDRLDRNLLTSLGSAALQPRPALSDTFGTPSGHFLIHYAKTGGDAVLNPTQDSDGDGVPNYVENLGAIADSVYQHIVVDRRYPAPPTDGFYPQGGDDRFDIYLKNLSASFFGLSYLDSVNLGGADSLKATAFMLLDNDYSTIPGYESRPYDAVRVTLAHEFFHAVQFGIDYTEQEFVPLPGVGRYWMEMSAVWMEEQLYDNINDYYNYLPYFFQAPSRSIQQFLNVYDNHPYASVVLPIFLSEKFGTDIIRDIWMRCGEYGYGPSFLQAAQDAIDSASNHDQNWFSIFREFALWNYFTGARAASAPNNMGYPEKSNYPVIPDSTQIVGDTWRPLVAIHRDYPFTVTTSDNPSYLRPDHNAMGLIRMERLGKTQWKYKACGRNLNIDTLCVLRFVDSICTYETQIPTTLISQQCTPGSPTCELRTGCNDTIPARIDSTFDFFGGLDTLAPVWGLSIVQQYWPDITNNIASDSIVIDSALLVRPFPNPAFLFAMATSTPNTERLRSITFIFTPATNDYTRYHPGLPMQLGYSCSDSMGFDIGLANRPTAILTPYPNPAVTADMHGEKLHFRFQAPLDSLGFPPPSDPNVSIDIFDVSGQRLRTVTNIVMSDLRRGLWEVEWDMNNIAGSPVASGVYLCVARLRAGALGSPLIESTVKVLIVR